MVQLLQHAVHNHKVEGEDNLYEIVESDDHDCGANLCLNGSVVSHST